MRVLLLNQFFHPDLAATAQLATDLAEDLVREGMDVTALATRGAYLGGGRLAARDEHRGVRIERVRCTSLGKGSIARRLLDYGTFYGAALARVLAGPRYDVVIAMSTPPLVATIGAMVRNPKPLVLRQAQHERRSGPRGVREVMQAQHERTAHPLALSGRRRAPPADGARAKPEQFSKGERSRRGGTRFVYWLQDVYPELAVEFGVFGARSPVARGFDALSRWTLRRADAVVVLGEAMGDRVRRKGVAPSRVHVIPNWSDGAAVRPVPPADNAFLREHGLLGKRVALYSGNMGRAHDLETLFGAARLLRHRADLAFVFVGDGARRAEVEAAARELPSIRLLPYQSRERLGDSLSAGTLHLVTQAAFTVGLIEPSKLYGAMAAGRPVLFVGPAETEAGRTVAREGIGAVVRNGDAQGAAAAIEGILAGADTLGARTRAAFDSRYDRGIRTAQFAALLRGLA